MTDAYEILKGVPAPPSSKMKTGMTETLRRMEHLDCIVVPDSKKGSVYACAAQAGIKIRTRSNPDGRGTTVWRIDLPAEDTEDEDAGFDAASHMKTVMTPEGGLPSGRYTQPDPYGPCIWVNDTDSLGQPVNIHEKAKQLAEMLK
ncbi:MAG TPA: hypothetical protein VMQ76_00275 [Terracidiphilus sp.]|jgi:hypothetical protein|nr:hypothetical protein [Terracidiphilus sp.]